MRINTKGAKATDGSVQILQEAYQTPSGEIVYGIRQKGVKSAELTDDATARKKVAEDAGIAFTPVETDYIFPEKVNYYSSKTQSDEISAAALRTINPDTGQYFKNTLELDAWVRKNTNPKKSGNTQTATTTTSAKPKFN